MLHPAFPVSLLALAAPAVASLGDSAGRPAGVRWAQMSVHERIVIRVPRMTRAARVLVPVPVRYKEKKGPKCVAVAEMGGAQIVAPGAVDLAMAGGRRLRAKLDTDCGPMDFYNGFYLRPAADGKVCADRDVIRMRSGASCTITSFKTLQPAR
ncbi:hypothetical protein LPN01_16795 [Sphingomonas sp. A2-49]|uniref:hypothetical protein n=1 Tax=Sphingomonas sp. A2-49 TaxID=1391375 RepID=UPI0021CFB5BB|nr:hypothetical protein [Sphingomonas sp. A2-49]MCU6455739.1 hypothetical protein [Sphingomonas sp. A2-49]